MKFEYLRIPATNEDGIKRAEKLQSQGWKIIAVDFSYFLMERKTK